MLKKTAVHYVLPALSAIVFSTLYLPGAVPAYAAAAPLELAVETAWLSGRADGNETEQITVRYESVMGADAMSTVYNPLQESLDAMNSTEIMKSQSYLDWYLELYQNHVDRGEALSDFISCTYYNTALVKRADSTVTSIVYQTEAYAGGAHPNTWHTAYNFRTADGSELTLSDVFTDTDTLRRMLNDQLALHYPDLDLSPLDDYDLEYLTWSLDNDGLNIYIGEYVISALYDGFQTAHFPYADYSRYFADWVLDADSASGIELGNYEVVWRDLDQNGGMESIRAGMNIGEGTDAENNRTLYIYYNDESQSVALPPCQDLFTSLLDLETGTYLYIEASLDLDLAYTGTFRLDPNSDTSITYVGSEIPEGAGLHVSHIMIQYPLTLTDEELIDDGDAYDWSYTGDGEAEGDWMYSGDDGSDGAPLYDDSEYYDPAPPFYGVWISASKDFEASWELAELIYADGVEGYVFLSSEWSNLNPEPWYLVSAGLYYTYDEALAGLARIQEAGYTDAYIKWSGEALF